MKAIRSLEIGTWHLYLEKFDLWTDQQLSDYIRIGTDDRIYAIAELLRREIRQSASPPPPGSTRCS